MIRINSFFELKDENLKEELHLIMDELVEKSSKESGCEGYDLFICRKNPCKYMIYECWQDDATLSLHKTQEHFLRLVPLFKGLTKNGTHVEKYSID